MQDKRLENLDFGGEFLKPLVCKKCPSAILSKSLMGELACICGNNIRACPYQMGYVDNNNYIVKLCGNDKITLDDFV